MSDWLFGFTVGCLVGQMWCYVYGIRELTKAPKKPSIHKEASRIMDHADDVIKKGGAK